MIDAAIALVRLGSAPIGLRPLRVEFGRWGLICIRSAVLELRSRPSTSNVLFALPGLWALHLVFGASYKRLQLFWGRRPLGPAHSPMLLLINPKYSRQVAKLTRTIERHPSGPRDAWRQ